MVEVKGLFITAIFVLCSCLAWGQERAVVAGLENDATYRRLVEEERALLKTADSISLAMAELRTSFRTDTLNRAANSAALLRMEEESFDVRTTMAQIAGKINAIEQQWVLKGLSHGVVAMPTEETEEETVKGTTEANLVHCAFFGRNLSPEQWEELRTAQRAESELPRLVAAYKANHLKMKELATRYDFCKTELDAQNIKARFDDLTAQNAAIDSQINERWASVVDSKGYVYNLAAEKRGLEKLPESWNNYIARAREVESTLAGKCASEAVLSYIAAKPMLVEYEIELAQTIDNQMAADSLKTVLTALGTTEKAAAGLAPVVLKERSFIEFVDATVRRAPVYGPKNAIPDVPVHARGVVWRVMVGNFSSPPGISIFRNVAPLWVMRAAGSGSGSGSSGSGSGGRFVYFAGAYRTEAEAVAATQRLARVGFRKPVAAAWIDGVYFDPSGSSSGGSSGGSGSGSGSGSGLGSSSGEFYNIELTGIEELTPEIRAAIGTRDVARNGLHGFIVGPIPDGAAARKLRLELGEVAAKNSADLPAFDVKIVKKNH